MILWDQTFPNNGDILPMPGSWLQHKKSLNPGLAKIPLLKVVKHLYLLQEKHAYKCKINMVIKWVSRKPLIAPSVVKLSAAIRIQASWQRREHDAHHLLS